MQLDYFNGTLSNKEAKINWGMLMCCFYNGNLRALNFAMVS